MIDEPIFWVINFLVFMIGYVLGRKDVNRGE